MTASATATRKSAEKKAEKLASLTIIGRATFKSNGAVLFGVRSGEKVYHLTLIAGKIRSCVDAATGESCKAHQYRGTCCHEERVMLYEAKRQQELDGAAAVAPLVLGSAFAQDLPVHLDDEFSAQPEPTKPATIDAGSIPFVDAYAKVLTRLTMGTVIDSRETARSMGMGEQFLLNILSDLRTDGKLVFKCVDEGKYYVNTPEQAYRETFFYGDFAA